MKVRSLPNNLFLWGFFFCLFFTVAVAFPIAAKSAETTQGSISLSPGSGPACSEVSVIASDFPSLTFDIDIYWNPDNENVRVFHGVADGSRNYVFKFQVPGNATEGQNTIRLYGYNSDCPPGQSCPHIPVSLEKNATFQVTENSVGQDGYCPEALLVGSNAPAIVSKLPSTGVPLFQMLSLGLLCVFAFVLMIPALKRNLSGRI